MTYYKRNIDAKLLEWKDSARRKPLLIRGARQVGKSTAVRQLGKVFKYFVEINLESQPSIKQLFTKDIDVHRTCEAISATIGIPVVAGETLLFIDEIQVSQEAIMSLRYFKEDYPELHVIAAGSLLEFTLEELPSFGVGRIRSLYMYPFSFDEFLLAQGLDTTVNFKCKATSPLPDAVHNMLVEQLKSFYLVGGMPAAVTEWIESKSYIECTHIHNDILDTYQDDFSKYKSRVSPALLRKVLRSVALQAGGKFVFRQVADDIHSSLIKDALHLLTLAGLIKPVTHSDGNGVPLGAEENSSYTKYLFLDLGLMQTMLGTPASNILLSSDVDFVNKGAASEMFAGLELVKNHDCFQKAEMYYWQNMARGTNAEIDYLVARNGVVLPIEVKASTRGSMQSLWLFMRKKGLHNAIRTSLENFGKFEYVDNEAHDDVRHVDIVPLYALSNL
ncbi:ATP-binding protein [Prevotella sp.]|uniref:ATP-binding protein n=1 Tax=Prevotella sp. TaxID=59823 RepID=UPI003AF414DE